MDFVHSQVADRPWECDARLEPTVTGGRARAAVGHGRWTWHTPEPWPTGIPAPVPRRTSRLA